MVSDWKPGQPLARLEVDGKPLVMKVADIPSGFRLRLRGADLKCHVRTPRAAELALLAADTEALGLLVGDAQAKASASAPEAQRRALQAAQAQMQNVAGHAAFKAARDRVLQAEQVFLKAHAALISAGAAIGERNQFSIFKASNELRRITYGA